MIMFFVLTLVKIYNSCFIRPTSYNTTDGRNFFKGSKISRYVYAWFVSKFDHPLTSPLPSPGCEDCGQL